MSTTWRESYSLPRIFKGRRERTGPPEVWGSTGRETLAPDKPISG